MKPLLSLAMIVKNEAAGIVRTLESCRGIVDRWDIVDTGSIDGTQELIRQTMAGVPGQLYEIPFVDFSTTRNRALDLAEENARFVLMLSGDEVLIGAGGLRSALAADLWGEGPPGAYDLLIRFGDDTEYKAPRITRTDSRFRYVGVTHEVLRHPMGDAPAGSLPAMVHYDPPPNQDKRPRWELDRQLLTAELERNPDNARATFYVAQTEHCLGNLYDAAHLYQRRAELGGFREERFESLLRIAQILESLGFSRHRVEQAYLEANSFAPHRAEPLYWLARYMAAHGDWLVARTFAIEAVGRPYPTQDRLFVDRSVYAGKARELADRCRRMTDGEGREKEASSSAAA